MKPVDICHIRFRVVLRMNMKHSVVTKIVKIQEDWISNFRKEIWWNVYEHHYKKERAGP